MVESRKLPRTWKLLGGPGFVGNQKEVKEFIEAHIRENLGEDLAHGVVVLPLQGRHVKTFQIEISVQLVPTPSDDYLLPADEEKSIDTSDYSSEQITNRRG